MKNIMYIEPNFVNSRQEEIIVDNAHTGQFEVTEYTPDLEDYCVAIDLQVEINSRQTGCSDINGKQYCFTWSTKPKDGKNVGSFFEGKSKEVNTYIKFNKDWKENKKGFLQIERKKEGEKFLSTDPMTMGTYEDAVTEGGTTESFGINSINIEYKNYTIPQVTIEFTDIRGISLFSPEELRHSDTVNVNGTDISGSIKRDVAGSFFKCFFTAPYPKFKLMVKGFYGKPVSYELCCVDFRARFNSDSGNFGATAKFMGYAFSLLNDVTFNAILSAPYCKYIGKEYWLNNVKNGNFTLDDGSSMITLPEIVKKLKKINTSMEKISQTSPIAEESRVYSNVSETLKAVDSAYQTYFNDAIKKIKDKLGYDVDESLIVYGKDMYRFALYSDNNEDDNDTYDVDDSEELFTKLKDTIKEESKNLSFPSPSKIDIAFKDVNSELETLKEQNLQLSTDKKYVYIYDGSDLGYFITNKSGENALNMQKNDEQISVEKDAVTKELLGFNPNVQNITKIIMAHLETLLHMIYTCSNNVNSKDRKAMDIGLDTTDVKLSNDIVPPFPRIDINKVNNGIIQKEESWMGELPKGKGEEETVLINKLLLGVDEVSDIFQQVINNAAKEEKATSVMPVPIVPLDFKISSNPFDNTINFNDISDVVGRIGLRMFNVFGLSNIEDYEYENMGAADAINFISGVKKKPSKSFLKQLFNGVLTDELIKKCLCNDDSCSNYKNGSNLWAWNDNKDETASGLMELTQDENEYEFLLYRQNIDGTGNERTIFPIQNLNWDNNVFNMSSNKYLKSSEDAIVTVSNVEDSDYETINEMLFSIDFSCKKYSEYKNLMEVNDDVLDYCDEIGLDEDDITDYMKFINFPCNENFSNKRNNSDDINNSQNENSYILPTERKEDITEGFAFKSGLGFGYDFSDVRTRLFTSSKDKVIECIKNNNLENYTIPCFSGFDDDGKVTKDTSLFGQYFYYVQISNYFKALFFLLSFGEFYKLDEAIKYLVEDKKSFKLMPYSLILTIGGLLYCNSHKDELRDSNAGIAKKILPLYYNDSLEKLRNEIRNFLIKEFKSWVDNENGFKYYQKELEIRGIGTITNSCELLNQFSGFKHFEAFSVSGYTCIEDFIFKNFNDEFFKNYISFRMGNVKNASLKLFNRETSEVIQALTSFIVKSCVVIMPTKYSLNKDSGVVKIKKDSEKYIASFVKELKNLYEAYNTPETLSSSDDDVSDENIKIALYKYIKVLWDKWLSGTKEEEWSIENFYNDNWFFIDSFYNKCGDLLINLGNLCNDIVMNQTADQGMSLLSFLSMMYEGNRFKLFCVQNFLDLTNGENAPKKMEKLFTPMPYEQISYDDIDKHPSFVILYTNEYSSNLDIKTSEYNNDSFNINDEKNLPLAIINKTDYTGYKIPAFGVSYGKRYQSYFKNIDVSMDTPTRTEQAIKAEFMLADMNSSSSESNRNVTTIGQDLFTINSNNAYTCTVTMMGCAWIQPLMYFQLLNIPMFRGAYLIQKVTHKITPGNMETTFVGTRMPAVSTRKVNKAFILKSNYETRTDYVDKKGENADITNDCEYRYFSTAVGNGPTMPEDELNMKLTDYEKKYEKFGDIVKPSIKNYTVKQFLGGVIYKEAGNQDELGKQLVATVLFNRYMYYNKNLTKLFHNKQHEVPTKASDISDENTQIAYDIFSNSPSSLVGKTTKIYKQVPIWEYGENTKKLTYTKSITLEDVQKIDAYCTTNGYNMSTPIGSRKDENGVWHDDVESERNARAELGLESFNFWHRCLLIMQHDTSENALGHVFTNGAWVKNKKYWSENKEEVKSKDLIDKLYESIEKTVKYSKKITINSISKENDSSDENAFFIKAEPKKALANVFDAVLNTYYSDIKGLYWYVNNDSTETPSKVKIVVDKGKNSTDKTIALVNKNGSVVTDYDKLCEFFYMALKKHYKSINSSNIADFKLECKNFTNLTSSSEDSIIIATMQKYIGNKNIKDCGDIMNNIAPEGFTWNGDGQNITPNATVKELPFYNISGATEYCFKNIAVVNYVKGCCGNCAKKVREAMMKGGEANLGSWPVSACAYKHFMELWGFTKVYDNQAPNTNNFTPLDGDIAVVAGLENGKRGVTDLHGHIQMYCKDKGWVSDYVDSKPYCYNSPNGRPYIIYRWKGKTKEE